MLLREIRDERRWVNHLLVDRRDRSRAVHQGLWTLLVRNRLRRHAQSDSGSNHSKP